MATTRTTHYIDEETIKKNAGSNHDLLGFALRLNELMVERDFSQEKLAEKTGLSETAIHKYRSGKAEPKLSNLRKIAETLEVDCSYLITGTRSEYTQLSSLDLSDKSIDKFINQYATNDFRPWALPINTLIETRAFDTMLDHLYSLDFFCNAASDQEKKYRALINSIIKDKVWPSDEGHEAIDKLIDYRTRIGYAVFSLSEAIQDAANEISHYKEVNEILNNLIADLYNARFNAQSIK